jgi:hypothetical protein
VPCRGGYASDQALRAFGAALIAMLAAHLPRLAGGSLWGYEVDKRRLVALVGSFSDCSGAGSGSDCHGRSCGIRAVPRRPVDTAVSKRVRPSSGHCRSLDSHTARGALSVGLDLARPRPAETCGLCPPVPAAPPCRPSQLARIWHAGRSTEQRIERNALAARGVPAVQLKASATVGQGRAQPSRWAEQLGARSPEPDD